MNLNLTFNFSFSMSALCLYMVQVCCLILSPVWAKGKVEGNLSSTIVVSNEAEIYIAPGTITNIKVTPEKNKKQKDLVQPQKKNEVKIKEELKENLTSKELPVIFYKTQHPSSQKFLTFADSMAMSVPQSSSFRIMGVSGLFYYKNIAFKFYSEKNSVHIESQYGCLYFTHFEIRPPPISGINFPKRLT